MSKPVSNRHLIERGAHSFLNSLHLDATVAALLLVLVVGVVSNFSTLRSVAGMISELSASAEAPIKFKSIETDTPRLTPSMTAALDHVALRYRVSPDVLLPVFEAVQSAASERRLDPLLIIAVIGIESRFNPFSQSPMGAQGLMQVIPRYHQDKVPKAAPASPFLDPETNVRIGVRILQEAIRRQGGLREGLQYYAGAMDDEEQVYANKVLGEKLRLEQAGRRKDSTAV